MSLRESMNAVDPIIPTEVITSDDLIFPLISSIFFSAKLLTKYLWIPPGIPTSEIIENIVTKDIIDDEIPIMSGEVILDKISQKRKPDTKLFMASKYKYIAPFPTVFLFIILPIFITLN